MVAFANHDALLMLDFKTANTLEAFRRNFCAIWCHQKNREQSSYPLRKRIKALF